MKDKLLLIVFVIILAIVSAGILTGAELLTEDRIIVNEQLRIKSSVLNAFDISFEENDIDEIYNDNITEDVLKDSETGEDLILYKTNNDEISFVFEGAGLWGPITGIIAMTSDMETIVGIRILAQEETPGLGGRVAEDDYLAKFQGKKVVPSLIIVKNSRNTGADNEVDAITGATLTSKAFQDILNMNITKYKDLVVD